MVYHFWVSGSTFGFWDNSRSCSLHFDFLLLLLHENLTQQAATFHSITRLNSLTFAKDKDSIFAANAMNVTLNNLLLLLYNLGASQSFPGVVHGIFCDSCAIIKSHSWDLFPYAWYRKLHNFLIFLQIIT